LGDGNFFQRFDAAELFAHFRFGNDLHFRAIEMRASTGMRFKAKLQPIQPARLAVGESGLRLMMAEGGKAKGRAGSPLPAAQTFHPTARTE